MGVKGLTKVKHVFKKFFKVHIPPFPQDNSILLFIVIALRLKATPALLSKLFIFHTSFKWSDYFIVVKGKWKLCFLLMPCMTCLKNIFFLQ